MHALSTTVQPCQLRHGATSRCAKLCFVLQLRAAYYALTDDEEKEIMGHPSVADFLFFLVKAAKQLVYSYTVEARLIFGDAVFSRHPPARLLRGSSNTESFHYAQTVFSNPLFSMQSIWASNPKRPSWIARIGSSQGLKKADM